MLRSSRKLETRHKQAGILQNSKQPFYDTLIRTSGLGGTIPTIADREQLFTNRARPDTLQALTNLDNGSTLPSDQSHVTLALRAFIWFRNAMIRGPQNASNVITAGENGDYSATGANTFFGSAGDGIGNTLGSIRDVYRLLWQSMEQLHWSFGTGEKFSIVNMPTKYFPDGGGLSGDMGGTSDLIHWQNGSPDHTAILRLARAILLPPRQNVKCEANIFQLPDGGNGGVAGVSVTGTAIPRNMLSLRDNLNARDGLQKVVSFTFDGLFARDVQ